MAKKTEKRKQVQHECMVAITKDELVERAGEMAKLMDDHNQAEEAFKEESKEKKAELKELRDRIEELGEIIRTKKENREVNCYEVPDFDKGVVEIFRTDTDERVHARQLLPEDRQQEI